MMWFRKLSHHWQDKVLSIGGLVFIATLVGPLMDSNTKFDQVSSLATGTALLIFAMTMASLKLTKTAITNAITGMLWLGLGFFRHL